MSVKRWHQCAEKKGELEEQEQQICQKFKTNVINKQFSQLSGAELFQPITKRLDKAATKDPELAEEEELDYGMDEFDRLNPFCFTCLPPINSAFSLIKSLTVKSAGKPVYEADNIQKVIFIKNLLDYSDDYARSAAKSQFWYLDNDATNVTSDAATNLGIHACGLLSHGGLTTETIIPFNCYSFFEELSDRLQPPIQLEFEIVLQDDNKVIFQNDGTGRRIVVRKFELGVPQLTLTSEGQKQVNENFLKPTQWTYLKETLHFSSSRRDASGSWLITPGVKTPKHVFVFFQQTQKQNALTQNPYLFDTFDIDGDNAAKLSTCRLQYGTSYYPELDYDGDFKLRILNDLINYRRSQEFEFALPAK